MLSDDFGTLDAEYKCELRSQQHGALSPQRAAVSLVLMFYHLLCANTVKSNKKKKGFSILMLKFGRFRKTLVFLQSTSRTNKFRIFRNKQKLLTRRSADAVCV